MRYFLKIEKKKIEKKEEEKKGSGLGLRNRVLFSVYPGSSQYQHVIGAAWVYGLVGLWVCAE
jgi:hypothetical protein